MKTSSPKYPEKPLLLIHLRIRLRNPTTSLARNTDTVCTFTASATMPISPVLALSTSSTVPGATIFYPASAAEGKEPMLGALILCVR